MPKTKPAKPAKKKVASKKVAPAVKSAVKKKGEKSERMVELETNTPPVPQSAVTATEKAEQRDGNPYESDPAKAHAWKHGCAVGQYAGFYQDLPPVGDKHTTGDGQEIEVVDHDSALEIFVERAMAQNIVEITELRYNADEDVHEAFLEGVMTGVDSKWEERSPKFYKWGK